MKRQISMRFLASELSALNAWYDIIYWEKIPSVSELATDVHIWNRVREMESGLGIGSIGCSIGFLWQH